MLPTKVVEKNKTFYPQYTFTVLFFEMLVIKQNGVNMPEWLPYVYYFITFFIVA
jgi:hypothetical protein